MDHWPLIRHFHCQFKVELIILSWYWSWNCVEVIRAWKSKCLCCDTMRGRFFISVLKSTIACFEAFSLHYSTFSLIIHLKSSVAYGSKSARPTKVFWEIIKRWFAFLWLLPKLLIWCHHTSEDLEKIKEHSVEYAQEDSSCGSDYGLLYYARQH